MKIELIKKIQELKSKSGTRFEIGVGMNENQINEIQEKLNVSLPLSYITFLQLFGSMYLGLYDLRYNSKKIILSTINLRESSLPNNYIQIGDDNGEHILIIDTSINENGKNPVYLISLTTIAHWNELKDNEKSIEKLANSFEEFLEKELEEEMMK